MFICSFKKFLKRFEHLLPNCAARRKGKGSKRINLRQFLRESYQSLSIVFTRTQGQTDDIFHERSLYSIQWLWASWCKKRRKG